MRMSLITNLNNKTPIESCIRDLTDAREAGFSRLWTRACLRAWA
jgi:5,10-methylenetetrahydromethanopterin reductase